MLVGGHFLFSSKLAILFYFILFIYLLDGSTSLHAVINDDGGDRKEGRVLSD